MKHSSYSVLLGVPHDSLEVASGYAASYPSLEAAVAAVEADMAQMKEQDGKFFSWAKSDKGFLLYGDDHQVAAWEDAGGEFLVIVRDYEAYLAA